MSASPRLETHKTLMEVVAIWFGLLATLAAGLYTLNEYWENKAQSRVTRTLEFNTLYYGERIQGASDLIWTAWSNDQEYEVAAGSSEAFKAYSLKVAQSVAQSVSIMVGFYDSLYACMRRELCDAATAIALFGDRAVRFERLHRHFIEQRRLKDSGLYAEGLRALARISHAATKP